MNIFSCDDKRTLATVLVELGPKLSERGIERIALDPMVGKIVITALLVDFVAMLGRQ